MFTLGWGSDVDSVRKDIWSALSHIRVNFPGARASHRGDLLTLCGGASGPGEGSAQFCWHKLMKSHGNTGLQETLGFHFGMGAVAFGSCGNVLHTVEKNAALEQGIAAISGKTKKVSAD